VILVRFFATLQDGRRVRVVGWQPLPGEFGPGGKAMWGPVVELPEERVPQGLTGVLVEQVPTRLGRWLGACERQWWTP
jgi:hypothetical protein